MNKWKFRRDDPCDTVIKTEKMQAVAVYYFKFINERLVQGTFCPLLMIQVKENMD